MTSARPVPCTTHPPAASIDIAAQAALYRVMVENTIDIVICYNAARARIYVSPASREMLGYEPAELLGSEVETVIHPADFPRVHPDFLAFGPDNPNMTATFRARRKDGRYIWIEAHYRYATVDGTSVAVMRDITARKNTEIMLEAANEKLAAANEILRKLAQQDGLTGLANRRRFDELLEQEYRRAARQQTPLALMLLDVDSFKAYNDRYGHIAGDECLRRISRTAEGVLQRPSDHVARYGGEEFVALLPATDLAGGIVLAERLREAIAALAIEHLGSHHRVVTISIGVCVATSFEDNNPAQLVEAADRALYHAKLEGRNCVRSSQTNVFVSAE